METATEAISEYTKEVGGRQVPMWDSDEVDEIVIAQVRRRHTLSIPLWNWNYLKFVSTGDFVFACGFRYHGHHLD